MAEINLPVSILYSENAGTKPNASQVDVGQLWINLADGTFGTKNSSGAIVSYGLLTEDQREQIGTGATWGSIDGDITQQTDLQNALNDKANLSGANFTGSVTVGGQSVVTINQLDNYVTVGSDITGNAATATTADTANALTTARSISASGDATWSVSFNGSSNVSSALTLANSGVSAGSYGLTSSSALSFGQAFNVPYITVDAKGRVTGATTNTITLPQTPTTITGNAGSATKLQTARTIAISGDAEGSATFDGSADISIELDVVTAQTSDTATTASQANLLVTTRTIDGVQFNGSANVSHYAVCSTVGDAVSKTASITGFILAVGATAIVTLTNGNSASNPTLNISSTGAHPIINTGNPLGNVSAGATIMVVYDGTNYQVVGGAGGVDFSQYYTKAEMDGKFLPIMTPTAQGTMSIYDATESAALPIVQAYNEAKASSEQNTGVLNCYTKEEADALFATIMNPTIIDTLTIQDGADTQVLSAKE